MSAKNNSAIKVKSAIPRRKQDLLRWYGWGYKDSAFKVVDNETAVFTGDRYQIAGKSLPDFIPWVKEVFDVDLSQTPVPPEPPAAYPASRLPADACGELRAVAPLSTDGLDRLIRAHGQTLRDMVRLRTDAFPRIPDAVVWPSCHDDVERIVRLAAQHSFVLVPFGGGTSVSGAITCPEREPRPIVALDTSDMNSILWIDEGQLLARCQSGIVGQDLEREMRARGFTVGHEPDSYEFSTLGGWVATRASGMKKNTYGNIEDLMVHVRTVTPRGVLERGCRVPRISSGPDWEHVVMGSEGCLGVVTEVTLKIRPLPPVTRYGSVVFRDWDAGFEFEREVARRRLQPSSVRLLDNEQFRFGHALRTPSTWGGVVLDGLKKAYLTRVRGFDPHKLCVCTLLYEGSERAVAEHERELHKIATALGGVPAGATNGEIGYTLTFVIAYIRDLGLDYNIVAESFETSVPWDRARALCRNVKRRLADECARHRIRHYLSSCRLTQTYVLCEQDLGLDYNIVAESFETSVPWDRARALCRNVKRRLADECARHRIRHYLSSCRLTQTYVLCEQDLGLDYNIVAESFETSVPWDRARALCRNVKRRLADECARHRIRHYLSSCRLTQTYVLCEQDLGLDYNIVAESFETSVPWDRARALCRNVKRRLADECARHRIRHYLSSCRLTQTYDAGCCVYFYFAFNSAACADAVAVYEDIEEKARDEIISSGGSISHHHGVGKLRKKWYTDTVSEAGQRLLLAAKAALDPDNIFALGNMGLLEGVDPIPPPPPPIHAGDDDVAKEDDTAARVKSKL